MGAMTASRTHAFARSISAAEREVIDAVPASMAVLDEHGVIVAMNRAWHEFGVANGRGDTRDDLGRDYAALAENPVGFDPHFAPATATGIRSVVSGRTSRFTTVYNCPGVTGDRWFRMLVIRAGMVSESLRVLVLHRALSEAPTPGDLLPAGDELALRWVGVSTRCGWCGLRARNTLGRWVPIDEAPAALTLSFGLCPACFDQMRRTGEVPAQGS
jgi:hypothetical protein